MGIFSKIKKIIHNPRILIMYLLAKINFKFIPDKVYLKFEYLVHVRKRLDLENPKTFNEKLQWLKLYDRNPIYPKLVDKYEVRKIISEKIGEEYLVPLIGVYDSFQEIEFNDLPTAFVIKPNHTSGDVFICKNKSEINKTKLEKLITKWLKRKYYWIHREWPYKLVKPKIMIEEYLEDKKTKTLNDYKFMCFNGDVKCSFVVSNRSSSNGLNVDFFDKEWNKLPFERHYSNSNEEIPKPQNYEKMIKIAEILASGIPFVRIDFYEVDGKIFFGEMTFYPGSGIEEFTPDKYDYELGSWLELPHVN